MYKIININYYCPNCKEVIQKTTKSNNIKSLEVYECSKCKNMYSIIELKNNMLLDLISGQEYKIKELWESIPYVIKLICTAYVFRKLTEQFYNGGTYRKLIYDRLGFSTDAYEILYVNGGMTVNNALGYCKQRYKEEELYE